MPSRGFALIVASPVLSPTSLAASVFAQYSTPTTECATTTPDENKSLVAAFFRAVASGEGAAFAEILTPDHVYRELSVDVPMTTPVCGAEGASEWANDRKEAFTDITTTFDPIIADGDMVSVLMTWTGKDTDTGADATWNSAGFFRIECGKIAENWAVADTLGRLMTSGDITPEDLASITAEATLAP